EVPDAWIDIGKATDRTKSNFESVANSMKVVGSTFVAISASGKEFYQVMTSTARHWKDLAVSTGTVSKNIFHATESLLKWTGILSLVTGGAGLFGFDRLASSVSSQRTAAMGVGSTYGNRAEFLTNFRRFGDPEGLLGRVSEAQSDPSKSIGLRVLGLNSEDLKGDSADVAIKALRRAAQIAKNDRPETLGIDPHLQMFSLEERRRLKSHPEEIEEMAAGFVTVHLPWVRQVPGGSLAVRLSGHTRRFL